MKKQITSTKSKLFLNKETITILNNFQSSKVVGGSATVGSGTIVLDLTKPVGRK